MAVARPTIPPPMTAISARAEDPVVRGMGEAVSVFIYCTDFLYAFL